MSALLWLSLSAGASLVVAGCGGAHADENNQVVSWTGIAGAITIQNVSNPIGNIESGTFAWTTRTGSAKVDLAQGTTNFDVEGLVINGTTFSGTAGPVSAVTGTLVCNPGADAQTVLDTPAVPLSTQGSAHFSGRIENIPTNCAAPIFLIRIASPAGAAGRWIATGTEPRSMTN
ncbi:MAG TPA: hypothetical protein VFU71_01310 [Burkholderiaceae bacterium]|nr:hypothetical protein [Burkholderiaceae bacterium]